MVGKAAPVPGLGGVEAIASGACAVGRRRWRWPGEAGGLLFICSWATSAAQAAAERGALAAGPAAADYARAHLRAAAARRPAPGWGRCQTPGRGQGSGGGAMVVTSSARGGGGDRAPSRRRGCGLSAPGAAALLAGASCLCYGRSLQGEFVHDDVWAIVNNPDVRPGAPLRWGIFSNDFWGKGMAENTSHKSYRPLCVLTFK